METEQSMEQNARIVLPVSGLKQEYALVRQGGQRGNSTKREVKQISYTVPWNSK